MKFFLTLAFLFSLGSTFGWVLELFYRRFFSAKKWINPGFLVGPCLPLYGFGLCGLYLLSSVDLSFISAAVPREICRLLMMAFTMTVIEYLAGIIFIVWMKVKLWDYSRKWGNLQGIICPEFSFYWALLGAIYYYLIHRFFAGAVTWVLAHVGFSFLIGMFYGILLIDVGWSMHLMARIRAFAKENHIVVRLEEFKKTVAERAERNRLVRFVFALQEKNRSMAESLREYLESWKKRTGEMMRKAAETGKRKFKSTNPAERDEPSDPSAENDHMEGES